MESGSGHEDDEENEAEIQISTFQGGISFLTLVRRSLFGMSMGI
jgi:hypothetical protein